MKRMRVKPLTAFRSISSGLPPLDPNRVYDAIEARNQPDYKEKGKIFLTIDFFNSFLLESGDYEVIETIREN